MYIFCLLILGSISEIKAKRECDNGNEFLYGGIRPIDRLAIVTYHAKFRYFAAKGLVPSQPQGDDLRPMVWDMGLESAALNSFDICNSTLHIINDGRWPSLGKSYVFHSMSELPYPDWEHVMNEFYLEHKYFKYPGKNNTKSTYAQIMSAKTTNIGCSFLVYRMNAELFPNIAFYLCLYGPGASDEAPPYPLIY